MSRKFILTSRTSEPLSACTEMILSRVVKRKNRINRKWRNSRAKLQWTLRISLYLQSYERRCVSYVSKNKEKTQNHRYWRQFKWTLVSNSQKRLKQMNSEFERILLFSVILWFYFVVILKNKFNLDIYDNKDIGSTVIFMDLHIRVCDCFHFSSLWVLPEVKSFTITNSFKFKIRTIKGSDFHFLKIKSLI